MLSLLFFYIQFQYISRLRESEINFVFCERVLYVCTAPEQKTKSANNGKDSMSLPLFQSLRVQQVAPTVSPVVSVGASALKCRGLHRRPAPFAREAKRFIYYIWRVLAALSKFITFQRTCFRRTSYTLNESFRQLAQADDQLPSLSQP